MNDKTQFKERLAATTDRIDKALAGYIKSGVNSYATDLFDALEYAMFPGGKRLRPLLLLGCSEAAGASEYDALPFACALELIHGYSLIHDDLPAIDDDDVRRGKPSCHVRFGEATAILAGDGLLNLAYEVLADACAKGDSARKAMAMAEIAKAAGINGMVVGQAAEMAWQNKTIDINVITYIHRNKTAALFAAAAAAGALLGGADIDITLRYKEAGANLGMAFQIQDDLDDLVLETQKDKLTYPMILGESRARADFESFADFAVNAFRDLTGDSFVTSIAGNVVRRQY